MPPAARIGDMHVCPMVNPGPVPHVGGPIVKGQPNVLTCKMPQARITDTCTCVGPPDMIAKGSSGVFVGGMPAARMGDNTAHGGVIVSGAPTVLIGETFAGVGGRGSAGGGAGACGASAPVTDQRTQASALAKSSKNSMPFCEVCRK